MIKLITVKEFGFTSSAMFNPTSIVKVVPPYSDEKPTFSFYTTGRVQPYKTKEFRNRQEAIEAFKDFYKTLTGEEAPRQIFE